jgi:hypothetical protein
MAAAVGLSAWAAADRVGVRLSGAAVEAGERELQASVRKRARTATKDERRRREWEAGGWKLDMGSFRTMSAKGKKDEMGSWT